MKHTEDNKIDKLFNGAFEDFEVEPSEASWLTIEKELNRDKVFKKRMLVVRYAVAASVLVCIFFGVLYISNDAPKNQVADNNTNTHATDSDHTTSPEKKALEQPKQETIIKVEPKQEKKQFADVVEIKSRSSVKKAPAKKNTTIINNGETRRLSEEEKNAIELLRKNEDTEKQLKAEQQQKIDQAKPAQTTVASVQPVRSERKEIGSVVDAVNYVAGRFSKDDSKMIAVNDNKAADGSKRKSYQVDLGIIKFSRVKHTN